MIQVENLAWRYGDSKEEYSPDKPVLDIFLILQGVPNPKLEDDS
jgi:hypothetical protein